MKLLRYAFTLALSLMAILTPATSRADTASLYLAPSSLSQPVGGNFTIYVGVNSGGNSINAVEATVTIPGILTITGTGTGGSLCSIWVQQPTVSGSSVSFKCGIPGGTTASGNLISISLRANAVGSGSAAISGARVLAGPGQDVTGGTSGGTYTVTAAATSGNSSGGSKTAPVPAAPSITSSTHPDQNKWYTNANPAFAWTKDSNVTGFSYLFDQTAATIPAAVISADATSLSYSNQADGIWYLHLRANTTNGWSSTSSYRVQIDRTAPTGLTVVTEPKQVSDKRPMVSFAATDATSGVDHYQLRLDQGSFKTVTSPYTPDTITSGDHTITVRAFDKAGNMAETATKITIKTIAAPKLTTPQPNTTLKLVEQLPVAGTADPTTTIEIAIDGTTVARNVKVARDGTWSYTHKSILLPGTHHITARASRDGILSPFSSPLTIKIDPSTIDLLGATISVYVVIAGLLIIIGLLVLLAACLYVISCRQYDRLRTRFIKQNQQAETNIEAHLADLQTGLRRDVQHDYPAAPTPAKQQLIKKIDADVTTTQEKVDEEIKRGMKDL